MNKHRPFPLLACLGAVLLPIAAQGAVSVVPASSTTAHAYAGSASATDLVNAGQATLSGSIVDPVGHGLFSPGGVNDGNYSNTLTDNTFFHAEAGDFDPWPDGTATATFDLDVTTNTLGYDITSVDTFMGWLQNSRAQANQTYSIEVSVIGSAAYTPLTTVSFTPFADVDGPAGDAYESHVSITEDATGILASGVDSIRFSFSDPRVSVTPDTGTFKGTVIREIDVQGVATVPEPAAAALLAFGALGLLRRRRA